jgi:CRP-like cAMP-binding protein
MRMDDAHAPGGRAAAARDRGDGIDMRMERRLMAAITPRLQNLQEPRALQRRDIRLGQAAQAFGLGGAPAEFGDQRLRALDKVDLFSGLSAKLRRQLADHLELAPFARGEAVTHEGAKDDGLYMIVEGEAVVRIGGGSNDSSGILGPRDVARLGPGQFFGEMSLMTGEARTATVIAATELLCYRMNKTAFQEILKETPAIADQIAEVLVMRRTALSAARDEREEVRRKRHETAKQDLLGRIRGFFGLDANR